MPICKCGRNVPLEKNDIKNLERVWFKIQTGDFVHGILLLGNLRETLFALSSTACIPDS